MATDKIGVHNINPLNNYTQFFRYGDQLNPWGDLIAMARSWCLLRPGGKALVGVPSGPDVIAYNSHRIYGPLGYAQLFANFEQVFTNTDFRCQFQQSLFI